MSDLATRAKAAGIAVHWEDATGRQRTVADDTLAAILDRLDRSTDGEATFVTADVGMPIVTTAAPGAATLALEHGPQRIVQVLSLIHI